MSTSELFEDTVGTRRSWRRTYDACIMFGCPRCRADAYSQCTNPLTGRTSHAPCRARQALADPVPFEAVS